ncbi:RlpA-like double-psi beta-barrel-protein domain-containing protein-containing protein, partial [Papiliotrema laurentii]
GSSSGKATYYAVGLGACGWTNSDSEYVVAMNAPQYSSGTCGQNIQITNPSTGKTQTAKIVDLCPGCSNGDLDMSPTLFSYLNDGNMDAGVFQMTWSYA